VFCYLNTLFFTMAAASTTTPFQSTSLVELYLSCTNLKDRDVFSKSDPFAVIFIRGSMTVLISVSYTLIKLLNFIENNNAWQALGKTETIQNCLNPVFSSSFKIEYFFEEVQDLKIEIYDEDDSRSQRLDDQQFLGSCQFTMGSLLASSGTKSFPLQYKSTLTNTVAGHVVVRYEEVRNSSDALNFQFRASKLTNKDGWFSKSDPFLTIERCMEDGKFLQVFRSETIDNNLNPTWKPFEITLQKLCNSDYNRPLRFQVFDEDPGGKYDFIGSATATLMNLMECSTAGT
jgi:Ca2+-dependent lipid-binding protein